MLEIKEYVGHKPTQVKQTTKKSTNKIKEEKTAKKK